MPNTIIEQAVYNVAGERVPFIKDSFTTEVCIEALRLFCERFEKKSFLKANEELRIINEHIYQQLKKQEDIL